MWYYLLTLLTASKLMDRLLVSGFVEWTKQTLSFVKLQEQTPEAS